MKPDVWWFVPQSLRQEDCHEFRASLSYSVRLCRRRAVVAEQVKVLTTKPGDLCSVPGPHMAGEKPTPTVLSGLVHTHSLMLK